MRDIYLCAQTWFGAKIVDGVGDVLRSSGSVENLTRLGGNAIVGVAVLSSLYSSWKSLQLILLNIVQLKVFKLLVYLRRMNFRGFKLLRYCVDTECRIP